MNDTVLLTGQHILQNHGIISHEGTISLPSGLPEVVKAFMESLLRST